MVTLKCDGTDYTETERCAAPVTHIDCKGFVYCTRHGQHRKYWCRCRKLKPAELRRLREGNTLPSYEGT